ncbi:neutral zinc metallopeptidase [Modestobacter sp. URMC 112]
MPSSPRRLLGVLLAAATVLSVVTGCAVALVPGSASPAAGQVGEVEAADFPIIGAVDDEIDVLARNALSDLNTYWAEQFPGTFDRQFTPLAGGYYSVDPGNVDPAQYPGGRIGCGEEPQAVENNAFYCPPSNQYPNSDAIQYDRVFLRELADQYGRFIPALVMAHEFGHAVQGRVGYPIDVSIAIETQADCFAGAWTAWVADGQAPNTTLQTPELDDLLRGYLLLRDPVGTGLGEQQAHGSYFDRVSAFQQGFDDGPVACRDAFGADRPYTQTGFVSDEDFASGGNADYPETERLLRESLPAFWTATLPRLGEQFSAPDLVAFDGTAPDCEGEDADTDLVYCAAEDAVGYDESDLIGPVYEEFGDYAVLTAVSIPYALAAREQLGLSTEGPDAVRSAVCLTGAFTAAVLERAVPNIVISPGDVDESVQFLLEYSAEPAVLGESGLTGFQLVDVFRGGVFQGLSACDVGA